MPAQDRGRHRGGSPGEDGGRGVLVRGSFGTGSRFRGLPASRVSGHRYTTNHIPVSGNTSPKIPHRATTVGVRRPTAPGTLGTPLKVTTNSFVVRIPEETFYCYDVKIEADKAMPAKFNVELIRILQEQVAPAVFTPRVAYDGHNNMFASRRLPFSRGDSQTFEVTLAPAREGGRPPKVYRVTLKRVAVISPTVLSHYQKGQQPYNPLVHKAFAAMNVVIRMEPMMRYPYNSRSFFVDRETYAVGSGLELWRGYRQSVRPGLRSILINIDISTGVMFAPGPMIDVCRAILENNKPNALVPRQGLFDRERLRLKRFLSNVRFTTSHKEKNGNASTKPKFLKGVSDLGAANYRFKLLDESETSVAEYFQSMGINLQYPNYVCIETSTGTVFPIELCNIIPGQLMRRQIPPDLTSSLLSFSTKTPEQRLNSIVAGPSVLQYGQSEYMRQFGMTVSTEPERCFARILPIPALNYGADSKRKLIRPINGSWNVDGQKLFKPATVTGWAVVVYDTIVVHKQDVLNIVRNFKRQADLLGIRGLSPNPPISYPPPRSLDVHKHLQAAGNAVYNATKQAPSLIVVIMPDNSYDLYQAIKHFGDVKRGVPTQCLKARKAKQGSPQYFANVWLKTNAKLGGINSVLDPQTQKFISDPANPTMIISAHVKNPAPGACDRPSFASVVGSIDSTATHYSAVSTAQNPCGETIPGFQDPVYELISRHMYWKNEQEKNQSAAPKRIIYFRGGFSEGQFQQVLDVELTGIKKACARHKINPTITIIMVGKRHHVRFFPTHGHADRSGNCPAGTVVDDVVGNPMKFDFYLQSHGGLLGTSRSTHYNVLHDENNFTTDSLQALTFALCHVCARATRSISIPAPLHYARMVCDRAGNHYDPSVDLYLFDEETSAVGGASTSAMQHYRDQFQPIHQSMRYKMFFQ